MLSALEKYCVTSFWPQWFHMRKHADMHWFSSLSNVSFVYSCFIYIFVVVLVLSFQKFDYVYWHGSIWVCPFWVLLNFLKLQVYVFPQIWEDFSYYSFKYFFKYFKYSPLLSDYSDMDTSSLLLSYMSFFFFNIFIGV